MGNIVYFATRPGVARVTTTIEGRVSTYRLHVVGVAQLQPLGNGWHAVGTGFGIDGAPFTLRAYNSAGKLVDTVTHGIGELVLCGRVRRRVYECLI